MKWNHGQWKTLILRGERRLNCGYSAGYWGYHGPRKLQTMKCCGEWERIKKYQLKVSPIPRRRNSWLKNLREWHNCNNSYLIKSSVLKIRIDLMRRRPFFQIWSCFIINYYQLFPSQYYQKTYFALKMLLHIFYYFCVP